MSDVRYALPTSKTLDSAARTLFALAPDVELPVLRDAVRAVALAYTDDVVDGMILGFLSPRDEGSRSSGIVKSFAELAKKVAHGLVRTAVNTTTRSEFERVTAFLRTQIFLEAAGSRLEIRLERSTADAFRRVIAARHAGRVHEEVPTFRAAMIAFAHEATQQYLVDPFSQLEMGFLARKAFDVGQASILSGCTSAISRAMTDDTKGDLVHLADFFERALEPA